MIPAEDAENDNLILAFPDEISKPTQTFKFSTNFDRISVVKPENITKDYYFTYNNSGNNNEVVTMKTFELRKTIQPEIYDLYCLDNGNKIKYQILGEFESNPSEGTISYKSPLGRELIGCKKGDVVAIMRPAGDIEYEILDIFVP